MNFILTISYNQDAADKRGAVGVQFQADDDIPFAVVLKGIKTFLDAAEAKHEKGEQLNTIGDVFGEGKS